MRFPTLLLPILLFALVLPGCNEAQIARAEQGVAQARKMYEDTLVARDQAKAMLDKATAIAALVQTEAGDQLIAKAKSAIAQAEEALPVLDAGVKAAEGALSAAKTSQANGGTGVDTFFAIVTSLITGGTSVALAAIPVINSIMKARKDADERAKQEAFEKEQWRKTAALNASHAARMERAESDEDVKDVGDDSRDAAATAGLTSYVAASRGKVATPV